MIKRIIVTRPAISLTTALVGLVCIFFIATKENQIKTERAKAVHFQEKKHAPTMTSLLPPSEYTPKQLEELQYRTVELDGEFMPNQEVYLANRTVANSSKPNSKKTSGFHIMAPFVLANGKTVWINRGWILRDPANRKNIPKIDSSPGNQIISGYISLENKDIFELRSAIDHVINGHIISLSFSLPKTDKDLVSDTTYPFLIIQTGQGADQLTRPAAGYLQETNYSFELRTWWFILMITIGFWFVSGVIDVKRRSNLVPRAQ
jgi:cytochrome oxidase assembly protein ShyY1